MLGLSLSPTGVAAWGGAVPFFTDELEDGAGTPVAITTSIATRQCWQKGAAIALAGTYDLSGEPTHMAARVGAGPWVQLSGETIGSGNWSGTLAYPAYAQGTLEVKPRNGLNVTPAQVANITVSDVFAICGQSNATGAATNAQVYTKTNFDFTVFDDGTWAARTTDDWIAAAANGSAWPHLAMALDEAGVPPVLVRGHTESGTGFSDNDWNEGDPSYAAAVADLEAAAPGGFKALLWDQGESDAIAGMSEAAYETALADMLDALQGEVTDFAAVPLIAMTLGEVSGASDAAVEAIRQAVADLAASDPDLSIGPTKLHMDLADDLHPSTDAQVEEIGLQWYRALAAAFYGAADPGAGPAIVSATPGDAGPSASLLSVVFDRTMQNATDTTGWSVADGGGAVAVSAAAAATTTIANDTVVLTCARDLVGPVTLSFGAGQNAVGATLKDVGSPVALPPAFVLDFDAGEGNGAGVLIGAILLEDGVSYWVLEDGTSQILLEGS